MTNDKDTAAVLISLPDTDSFPDSPTPEQLEEYDHWVDSQPEMKRDLIRQYGLTPFKKYGLKSDGTAPATYLRFQSVNNCMCAEGIHLTMIAYHHDGRVICMLGGVLADMLVEYQYLHEEPSAEVLVETEAGMEGLEVPPEVQEFLFDAQSKRLPPELSGIVTLSDGSQIELGKKPNVGGGVRIGARGRKLEH